MQIKLLTKEQKDKICEKYYNIPGNWPCEGCPIKVLICNRRFCYRNIDLLQKDINDYWNKEIEE